MRRLAAVLAVALTLAALPSALPAAAATRSALTFPVRRITRTFVDHTRKTPPNGAAHVEASDSRTLVTTIWIPEGKGPFPLIVYAHGYGGSGEGGANVVEPWAAAGFVVAAPTFPISSRAAEGYAGVADIANQPGDLRFVITRMLALSRRKGPLRGRVDAAHIGVAGHSLGGVTTLGYVERSCCQDPRVDAAISISGTPLIGGTDFKGKDVPLLLVHGDHDPTVNYSGSSSSYARAGPPKYLLTVLGGQHADFLAGGTSPAVGIVATTMLDFWNAYLTSDSTARARLLTDSVTNVTTMKADPGPELQRGSRHSSGPRVVPLFELPKGPEVNVFMKLRATKQQVARVRGAIRSSRDAEAFAYVDRAGALDEFRFIFRHDLDTLEKVKHERLPTSFRVVVAKPSRQSTLKRKLAHLKGVDTVATPFPPGARTNCQDDGADFEVYAKFDATVDELVILGNALAADAEITSVRPVGVEEQLQVFRCEFADRPDLLADIVPGALPFSYRVTVAPGTNVERFVTDLETLPPVDSVEPGDSHVSPVPSS
jgi:dienelactone hydrolase